MTFICLLMKKHIHWNIFSNNLIGQYRNDIVFKL